MRRLYVGDLVEDVRNDLGPAKLVDWDGGEATIEYFDSFSARVGVERRTVPTSALRKHTIWPQTRAFFQGADGTWRSGRVLQVDTDANDKREILVKVPDAEERNPYLRESQVFVRWHRPLLDPVEFAAAGGFESPYFAERRGSFLTEYMRQRSASKGLGAVLCSSVDLHEHQLQVVRRVLDDARQRYLLADEVGLGKTIEAGLVLRQLLLDNPRLSATIIAPPFLVAQWKEELFTRFHIADFPRATVRFCRDDDQESWWDSEVSPDLVVVDEAHRLAGAAHRFDTPRGEAFSALADLTRATQRVLLLSATPLIHNEEAFGAMLHLLEPDVYPLDSVELIKDRVRRRAEIGRLFFTLDEDMPGFLLTDKIQQIRSEIPGDDVLEGLLDALNEVRDTPQVGAAIRRVRVHISETHRLHRRLLRNRRSEALRETFGLRGRTQPKVVTVDEQRLDFLIHLVEAWRNAALDKVREEEDLGVAAARFASLVVAAGSDKEALIEWCDEQDDSGSATVEGDAIPEIEEALRRHALALDSSLVESAVDQLLSLRGHPKAVAFSSSTRTALRLAERLVQELGGDGRMVARHTADMNTEAALESVKRFLDPDSDCYYLVCDSSAEEGQNLQMASHVWHLDLPASANRLEQRVGRVDRYISASQDEPPKTTVLVKNWAGPTYATRWHECLADGFGVLEASIASLPHAVSALEEEFWARALGEGESGLNGYPAEVARRLDDAREEVRQQDALDAIEVVEDDQLLAEDLRRVEQRANDFEKATLELLSRQRGIPGNLRMNVTRQPDGCTEFGLAARPGPQMDDRDLPLIPWGLLPEIDRLSGKPGHFHRADAVRRRPPLRLFRYGEPLIDAVADYLRMDDRGRVFALWRTDPRASDVPRLYFRFSLSCEADPKPLQDVIESTPWHSPDVPALRRRLDSFLPPRPLEVWLDQNTVRVDDEDVLELLRRPYDKRRGDRNLDPRRRSGLWSVIPEESWEARLGQAREEALALARADSSLASAVERSRARSQELLDYRIEQLRVRGTRSGWDVDSQEIDFEQRVRDAIVSGVSIPLVRVDAFGAYVLSRHDPTPLRGPSE